MPNLVSEIKKEFKKNPVIMQEAMCFCLLEKAKNEFDEFLSGLEGEFNDLEKTELLGGCISRQKEFWETASEEETTGVASKILETYKYFLRLSLRKKPRR